MTGQLTTEDTPVTLTAQGSVTTADRKVPQGATKIDKIGISFAPDFAAADEAGLYLRLGGRGVGQGDHTIVLAAFGGQTVQAGADPTGTGDSIVLEDVDIPAIQGNDITIRAEMTGGDVGNVAVAVTLVFA